MSSSLEEPTFAFNEGSVRSRVTYWPRSFLRRGCAMKAVILAGGKGTRISEELHLRPKPMIEIGGRPMLWHIMSGYLHHGISDFIIALGYRGEMIKQYFANYALHSSDITVDTRRGEITLPPQLCRAMARNPGRHRAGHDDRRPAEAPRPLTSIPAKASA